MTTTPRKHTDAGHHREQTRALLYRTIFCAASGDALGFLHALTELRALNARGFDVCKN
jgi:hypothetical protein